MARRVGIVKDEIDILYASLNKLSQASTPVEQLEALSDYPRDRGASAGILMYIENDAQGRPIAADVVAEWITGKIPAVGVGTRMPVIGPLPWMDTPHRPMLVPDIASGMKNYPLVRDNFLQHHIQSTALLPLRNKERWVGLVLFSWSEPYLFDERDQRIFTATIQQAAPIIDATRLYEQAQRRAAELEAAKNESDILYAASAKLVRATAPTDVLDALTDYVRTQGAMITRLFYIHHGTRGEPETIELVAEWADTADKLQGVGSRFSPQAMGTAFLYKEHLHEPYTISDTQAYPQANERLRALYEKLGVRAVLWLPLTVNERGIGSVSIYFPTPRAFEDRDRRLYRGLIQQAAPVIDSIRLFEQAQRRAAELEAAKNEVDILYQASNKLTKAGSPDEVLDAMIDYARATDAAVTALFYFQNEGPGFPPWLEAVAQWTRDAKVPRIVGQRWLMDDLQTHGVFQTSPFTPLFIEDITTSPYFSDYIRGLYATLGVRSVVLMPLTGKEQRIGSVSIAWREVRSFDERDRRIYTGLTKLAAPIVDSLRLFEQNAERALRAENLAEENRLLYQLSAAINAATSFEDLVRAVARLDLGWQVAALALWENYDERLANYLEVYSLARTKTGELRFGVQRYPKAAFPIINTLGMGMWVIEDVLHDPRVDPVSVATFTSVRTKALIGAGMAINNRWIGGLSFHSAERRRYTERDLRLTAGVGDLVVAAVERIRLQTETGLRLRDLETVAQVSAATTSILTLGELLRTVAELTRVSFGHHHILIYLLDSSGDHLVRTGMSPAEDGLRGERVPMRSDSSLVARAGRTQRGIIVNDIANEPNFMKNPILPDAQSEMAVPMVIADRLVGVLDVQSREPYRFNEADARIMTTLADLIAVAIQNARLYEQAQELAALEERTRLARELHDSVSQALFGIALGARTARQMLNLNPAALAEPLDYVLSLAEAALTEMRALIFELRPESLENEGLIAALNKQAVSLKARHNLNVTTEFHAEPVLALEAKEALYRIAREALHNTFKHAQATEVTVRLAVEDDEVVLEVRDNGQGFDTNGSFPGHLGLQSMRERAARLGGAIRIESAPGQGTTIHVRIPSR